jgi:hypothetical protein
MCEEWWMWHRRREAVEGRRLWDEFERTRPVGEPEVPVDEPEVTLETADTAQSGEFADGERSSVAR